MGVLLWWHLLWNCPTHDRFPCRPSWIGHLWFGCSPCSLVWGCQQEFVIVLSHLVWCSPIKVTQSGVIFIVFVIGASLELGGGGVPGWDVCYLFGGNVGSKGYFVGLHLHPFFAILGVKMPEIFPSLASVLSSVGTSVKISLDMVRWFFLSFYHNFCWSCYFY